jgi:hypothetical protein
LEAISKVLDKYDSWLTKAVKTNHISKQSPLERKPMMVILEDKKDHIKQAFFYDLNPVVTDPKTEYLGSGCATISSRRVFVSLAALNVAAVER